MHNVSAGVVLSNVSLVLRSVTHFRAGLYACSAANSRGETVSQPALRLRIQCINSSLVHFLLTFDILYVPARRWIYISESIASERQSLAPSASPTWAVTILASKGGNFVSRFFSFLKILPISSGDFLVAMACSCLSFLHSANIVTKGHKHAYNSERHSKESFGNISINRILPHSEIKKCVARPSQATFPPSGVNERLAGVNITYID